MCLVPGCALLVKGEQGAFSGLLSGRVPPGLTSPQALPPSHTLVPPAHPARGSKYLSLGPPVPSPQPWLMWPMDRVKTQMHLKNPSLSSRKLPEATTKACELAGKVMVTRDCPEGRPSQVTVTQERALLSRRLK